MIDVGQIVAVHYDENDPSAHSIFLDVELRHNQAHDGPLRGNVRWCPQMAGPGFGSWWVPSVGADVFCVFPGIGPDGRAEDLDEGYAFGVVSSIPEPLQHGLTGKLSHGKPNADPPIVARRVFKGRPGEMQDDHFQGAHRIQIDGDQEQILLATRQTTVAGDEVRHFASTRQAVVDGNEWRWNNADHAHEVQGSRGVTVHGNDVGVFHADRTSTIEGNEARTIEGNSKSTIEGDETATTEGATSRESVGVLSWAFRAAVSFLGDVLVRIISQSEIRVSAPLVRLGAEAAVKKIVHEEMVNLFNGHQHDYLPGPGSVTQTSVPTTPAVIGVHTSTNARVDS